jgi:hypothetical protein
MSAIDARDALELALRRYFPAVSSVRLAAIMGHADKYASALAAEDLAHASTCWEKATGQARLAEAAAEYWGKTERYGRTA